MKIIKKISIILSILLVPVIAFAVQVTVPSAPSSGYVLLSTSTGLYVPAASSSFGILGLNFFTNSGATTSLTTGTILSAPVLNTTSTTSTSTIAGPITIGIATSSQNLPGFQGQSQFACGTFTIGSSTNSTDCSGTNPNYALNVFASSTSTFQAINTRELALGGQGAGLAAYSWILPNAVDTRLGFLAFGSKGQSLANNFNADLVGGFASGPWSATSHGSYISFGTTASGTTARTDNRVRINDNGSMVIGTTSSSTNASLTVAGNTDISGGLSTMTWVDPINDFNCAGTLATTTGTITSGTNIITLASVSGWTIGMGIDVASGTSATQDLLTTVSSISGNILTLAANATNNVTSGKVRHDDTACLQAAFNAAPNVHIRAGNYNVTGALTLSLPKMVWGDGVLARSATSTGFSATNLIENGTTTNWLNVAYGFSDVGFFGMQQASGTIAVGGYAIEATSTGVITDRMYQIHDMQIYGPFGGVKIGQMLSDAEIYHLFISVQGGSNSACFYYDEFAPYGDNKIHDNECTVTRTNGVSDANITYGIYISAADVSSWTNNKILRGNNDLYIDGSLSAVDGQRFIGNSFENGTSTLPIITVNSTTSNITALTFLGNEIGAASASNGILIGTTTKNISIQGNMFRQLVNGITVNTGATGIQINGNSFDTMTGINCVGCNEFQNDGNGYIGSHLGVNIATTSRGTLEVKQIVDTSSGGIGLTNSGVTVSARQYINSSGAFVIDGGAGGTTPVVINEGVGTVSIGTSTGTDALDVKSTFAVVNGTGRTWTLNNTGAGVTQNTNDNTIYQTDAVNRAGIFDGGVVVGNAFVTTLQNTLPTSGNALIVEGNTALGTTTASSKLSIQQAFGSTQRLLDIASTTSAGFATSSLFTVLSSGNTGIGTSTPQSQLTTTGTVTFSGLTSASGQNAVCKNSTTNVVVDSGAQTCALSSMYVKHDIFSISSDSAKEVMQLNPVQYITNDGNNPRYGFIAEDLNKIDPRLVFYAQKDVTIDDHLFKKGDPIGVDYATYTGLLTKFVQDQAKKLDAISAPAVNRVEQNWQWIVIGLLALGFIYQQVQIIKLKK